MSDNPTPTEAVEAVPSIGVRALNLARCLAEAEFRSDLDRCIDEAKAIMSNGPFQLAALKQPAPTDVEALNAAFDHGYKCARDSSKHYVTDEFIERRRNEMLAALAKSKR